MRNTTDTLRTPRLERCSSEQCYLHYSVQKKKAGVEPPTVTISNNNEKARKEENRFGTRV
jgi:hypothetical protein